MPTSPRVLQVLHGGDNDCLWLQRDAHLYLANVFDTEKASKVTKLRSVICIPCRHCLLQGFPSSSFTRAQHCLSERPDAHLCAAQLQPED